MKRAIIIHCWEGYPEYCWYPWVKKQLEEKSFEVKVPAFPETELPKMGKWVPYLQEQIGQPDENLYLIGHSVGCITILRYLETFFENEKIGGAILVAGSANNPGYEEIQSFFNAPLDFEKIKSKSKNGFIAIHSDNDPYVSLKEGEILKEKLGAELIIKHNMQHFSGAIEGEKACTELPDVIESIKKLSR